VGTVHENDDDFVLPPPYGKAQKHIEKFLAPLSNISGQLVQ